MKQLFSQHRRISSGTNPAPRRGWPPPRVVVAGPRAEDVLMGERRCRPGIRLCHDDVESDMDPIDLGTGALPKSWKHAVAYTPYPRPDGAKWCGKGLPARIEKIMTEGVRIETFEVPSASLPTPPPPPPPLSPPSHQPSPAKAATGASYAEVGARRVPSRFLDEHGVEHRFQVESGQYSFRDAEHFLSAPKARLVP